MVFTWWRGDTLVDRTDRWPHAKYMAIIEKTQKKLRLIHTLFLFEFKEVGVFSQNPKSRKNNGPIS